MGTAILGFLITECSLGICFPFALVLKERWRAKHSYIEGRPLIFTGSAWGLASSTSPALPAQASAAHGQLSPTPLPNTGSAN